MNGNRQNGQAMIEFAIMLPILLLLLLGGADLLMAISAHQNVSYVAQGTAQWCASTGSTNCPGSPAAQAQLLATQVGLMSPNKVSASTNFCSGCVSITATYAFAPIFPFFPSINMASTAIAYPTNGGGGGGGGGGGPGL